MSAISDSDRARWTAIRLLRWYPRPWRMRYEREMLALLEEIPVGWRQVGNIAATAAREWMSPRALGWPARSAAGRIQTVRMFAFLVCAFAIDGVARVVAARLLEGPFTVSDALESNAALLMAVPLLRITIAGLFRMKRVQRSRWAGTINRHRWLRYLSDWEVIALLLMYFPSLVMRHAEARPSYVTDTMWTLRPYMNIYLVWTCTYILVRSSRLTARLWKVQLRSLPRLVPQTRVAR